MQSLCSSDAANSFSQGEKIGYGFYEVSKDGEVAIRTHGLIETEIGGEKLEGFLQDPVLKAGIMTVRSFIRCLDVFGFTWKDHPPLEKQLDVSIWCFFLVELSKNKFLSNDDLDAFVKKYNLDRFFQVDAALSPAENRDDL